MNIVAADDRATQAAEILTEVLTSMSLDCFVWNIPENKIHGANMGPTYGRQDPGGPHVRHVNLAIRDILRLHQRPRLRTDIN